ncbi:MAG: 23S rRNA (guanosine(2251)-2'-O)-methyltransferase RlmB [Deltaproteobacteria bacterium]
MNYDKNSNKNKRQDREQQKNNKFKNEKWTQKKPKDDTDNSFNNKKHVDLNKDNDDVIIGINPVNEALKSGRTINKIMVTSGEKRGHVQGIVSQARREKIVVQEVAVNVIEKFANGGVHQGIIAFTSPYDYVDIDTILQKAEEKNEKPFVIIADGITDPHNLGALIRTGEALGAHGIIIPKRNSVAVNSTVAKASAGAVEHFLVARETNIQMCLEELKKKGLWIIGADAGAKQNLSDVDLKGGIGLVVGGEDKGIGRLIAEKCDYLIKIPMKGKVSSLNASVAGAILMYEAVRQRS